MNEMNNPSPNNWELTDVKEVKSLNLGNKNDLKMLVSLLDSEKWVMINSFYKNGNLKPPFLVLGRII